MPRPNQVSACFVSCAWSKPKSAELTHSSMIALTGGRWSSLLSHCSFSYQSSTKREAKTFPQLESMASLQTRSKTRCSTAYSGSFTPSRSGPTSKLDPHFRASIALTSRSTTHLTSFKIRKFGAWRPYRDTPRPPCDTKSRLVNARSCPTLWDYSCMSMASLDRTHQKANKQTPFACRRGHHSGCAAVWSRFFRRRGMLSPFLLGISSHLV